MNNIYSKKYNNMSATSLLREFTIVSVYITLSANANDKLKVFHNNICSLKNKEVWRHSI